MSIVYMGAFLKKNLPGTLSKIIVDQHVTFTMMPRSDQLFPAGLVGREVELRIVGLGCDGKNEGYLVELPADLLSYYRNMAPPHITVSVTNSSPKHTGRLQFASIEPFVVAAILGYYTDDGIVVNSGKLRMRA